MHILTKVIIHKPRSVVSLVTDFLIDGRRIGCLEGPRCTAGGGGAWDPNYDPGADFLDHNFLSSKNSG